jgi:O-acetyl-ADP-ribose deacetylase (regulator of RNase III)
MIKVVLGDITSLKADAIVNAANKSLLGGGGVDGAIHRAAGQELLAECRSLHGCETGQSKITDAYNLPCKKVIHTVGPIWLGGKFHEAEKLASCYQTSIAIAKKYGLTSIAFPCISTGVYRFPKVEAAKIAINTLKDEISKGYYGEITICCFDSESEAIYHSLI